MTNRKIDLDLTSNRKVILYLYTDEQKKKAERLLKKLNVKYEISLKETYAGSNAQLITGDEIDFDLIQTIEKKIKMF